MSNKVFSRTEIFYTQPEATFGQIPNSGGVATLTGAAAIRAIQFLMDRTTGTIVRKDKTGSRTATAGSAGRKIGKWSMNASLVTSGVAGTAPDHDDIYQALFGQAPTVKTGTVSIVSSTNASPIVMTVTGHGLSEYDCIQVSGHLVNTAANGFWSVHVVDANTIHLLGSTGNGVGVATGTINKAAVKYSPADTILSFSAWSARKPYATAMQRVAAGCVPTEATINLGEDIATMQANGPCFWHMDNKNFASATTEEKCGLTAFPDLSLLTPVTSGGAIAGFKGRFVIGGANTTRIKTATLKFNNGVELPMDTFNSGYADQPEADDRNVTLSFGMYEDDSTGQQVLEQAAIDKSSLDCILQLGTVAGSVIMGIARGVQLASPTRDDGGRSFMVNYGDSRAYGSSITALDEFALWML